MVMGRLTAYTFVRLEFRPTVSRDSSWTGTTSAFTGATKRMGVTSFFEGQTFLYELVKGAFRRLAHELQLNLFLVGVGRRDTEIVDLAGL